MNPPRIGLVLLVGVSLAKGDVLSTLTGQAERGDALARRQLAHMYEAGEGVPKDPVAAVRWLEMAAAEGDEESQLLLARKLLSGKGVAKDSEAALKWLQAAAAQGNDGARMELAGMYASGRGVKRDSKEAAKWYTQSAILGNPVAQCQLARMHMTGAGVPRNDLQAYLWAGAAVSGGDLVARRIVSTLEARMTPAQLAAARREAANFAASVRPTPEIPLPPEREEEPIDAILPVLPE